MSQQQSEWRSGLPLFSDKTLKHIGVTERSRTFSSSRMVYVGVGDREHFSSRPQIWNKDLATYVTAASEVHVTSIPSETRSLNDQTFTLSPSIKLHYLGCTSSAKPLRIAMDMTVDEARQLAQTLMAAVEAVGGDS